MVDLIATRAVSSIGQVVAITFTESAGLELRARIRHKLDQAIMAADEQTRPLLTASLNDLDAAPVGTIHSFAARVLRENGLAEGLLRRADVVDDPPEAELRASASRVLPTIEQLSAKDGLTIGRARGLIIDSVRVLTSHDVRPAIDEIDRDRVVDALSALDVALRQMTDAAQQATAVLGAPVPAWTEAEPVADALRAWLTRVVEDVDSAGNPPSLRGSAMAKAAWTSGTLSLGDKQRKAALAPLGLNTVKAWQGLAGAVISARNGAAQMVAGLTSVQLAVTLLDEAERSRENWVGRGVRTQDDLLARAAALLTSDADVRRTAHERYTRVLVDEFQDTDPVQVRMLVRLTADPDDASADPTPLPGRLYAVGDPQQAIYGWRGADVRSFHEVRARFEDGYGTVRSKPRNRRSRPEILDWVNAVFGGDSPWLGDFETLVHDRTDSGSVVVIRADPLTPDDVEHRPIVAAEAVREISTLLTPEEAGGQGLRPSDVAVLVRGRSQTGDYRAALVDAGIPVRDMTSRFLLDDPVIEGLVRAAMAIAHDEDEPSLVAALRSPLFACGDDDLVRYRLDGSAPDGTGRRTISLRAVPDPIDGDDAWARSARRVADKLTLLREIRYRARSASVPTVLEDLVHRTRAWALLAAAANDELELRDRVTALRTLLDDARRWADRDGGSVADFVDWLSEEAQDAHRTNSSLLDEPSVQAVRIMTMHSAKGLEFPAVVVAVPARAASESTPGIMVRDGRAWVRVGDELVSGKRFQGDSAVAGLCRRRGPSAAVRGGHPCPRPSGGRAGER